ncbi:MAG: PTS glucose transporter subunit IIA, partial [Oscillospiraceae bacterium]
KDGDRVKKGDLLITFDKDEISKAGYKTVTPMVICNSEDYGKITSVDSGKVNSGARLLEIK